jgi:DNA gyrase/topoisomerase IV subunit B
VDAIEFREVAQALLRNALQETAGGHCTTIVVEVSDDSIRVSDDGRGLPLHPHPRSGRPLLEVILTGPRRGPVNTLARINAHSLWLEVEVHHEGSIYGQRYELALPTGPLERRGDTPRRGTTIACAPVLGEAPRFEDLRAYVREVTSHEAGFRGRVRLRDLRHPARDETIVIA